MNVENVVCMWGIYFSLSLSHSAYMGLRTYDIHYILSLPWTTYRYARRTQERFTWLRAPDANESADGRQNFPCLRSVGSIWEPTRETKQPINAACSADRGLNVPVAVPVSVLESPQ